MENFTLTVLLTFFIFGSAWGRLQCPRNISTMWPANRRNSTQQLIWLRNEMGRASTSRGIILDAFIVTASDEHQGEYSAERDRRLRYISGFSGSSGYAVITKNKAVLWTDEDLQEQADQELDCNWSLITIGDPKNPTLIEWLRKELRHSYRVGADPKLIPSKIWEEWSRELAYEKIALVEISTNLVDQIWTIARPQYNTHSAFIVPLKYAGESSPEKVSKVRAYLTSMEADAMIVTSLDETAWLFNVRGRDAPFSPFVRSYVIITKDELHWYISREKATESVRRQLKIDTYGPFNVRQHAYEQILADIRTYSQAWRKVLIPGACAFSPGASQAILSAVPPEKRLVKQSPIIFLKAQKNQVEIEGMRNASLRDSTAFVEFLAYLEEQVQLGYNWTESAIARTLKGYRENMSLSQGIPFPTVAAFGAHGALGHYEPTNLTDVIVDDGSTLILEGGGHYYDGTSVITRTLHYGTPSRSQIEAYTKLIAALVPVSTLRFPASLVSSTVDLLVRARLWSEGMNYKHLTGHGIGAFSSVKESPIMIDFNSKEQLPFREGYFFTIGPGYYKPESYGIRLKNILEVKKDEKDNFLTFAETTLVPFDLRLIDETLLSNSEIRWLNSYHLRVKEGVGGELKKRGNMRSYDWLVERTRELPEGNFGCKGSLGVWWLVLGLLGISFGV